MDIPAPVRQILQRLRDRGHAAYAVGGCVRDTLLGRTPEDWDICTSALPEETERCFSGLRVIKTGLKHGTVTLLLEGKPFEITTFRRDGAYLDHRRPDRVDFIQSLEEDLSRRDFTVNAMAVGLDGAVIDPFGGRADLEARRVRCVGDPETRFREDALRILRGLRFSSQLEFSVSPATARAMVRCRDLLPWVSGERVYGELTKLLLGPGAAEVLAGYGEVFSAVLPEAAPATGFLRENPQHDRDIWGHTAQAVGLSRPEPRVRWALLLHDLGKPDCFTLDSQGTARFYGHPARSEALARQIFSRLHTDRETRDAVCTLVRYHDASLPPDRRTVRRWLSRLGPELLTELLEVQRADCLSHIQTPRAQARCAQVRELTVLAEQMLREPACFSLRDLAVGGGDVLALGVPPGPQVGALLRQLLDEVIEESCPNERPALLSRLRDLVSDPVEKG